MKKIILIITLSLLVIGFTSSVNAHDSVQELDRIDIVGEGIIEKEPDIAILKISISSKKSTLIKAKKIADANYQKALNKLKEAKIDKKDIKATQLTAQPQHEWVSNKMVYKGEKVSRTLSIIIRDLDKLSPLMQSLVESGISTINGLGSSFSNEKELRQQALAAAADNAKEKAQFLANRLGRELGPAFKISTQNTHSRPRYFNEGSERMMSTSSAQLAPPEEMFGTKEIKATVNVSFGLL